MAETMEALVPVPAGTLTDEDYERLLDAMPSLTEVALPIKVAAEPEKPASEIVIETAPVQLPKAKPPRACKICGHVDGNSVGRIRLGRIVKILKDGLQLLQVEPICNGCAEQLSPEERAKIGKIGALISVVGVENRQVYAARDDTLAYWTAWKAGEAEPLEVRRDKYRMVLCGVPNCRLCHDELAVRFTIVKRADGIRELAGICREQLAILAKVGVQNIRLFAYQSAVAELDRRNREDASKTAPPPKQPEIAVESEKPAVATEVKPQLSRAEREARRWDRRRKLALAVGNTRFGAGKRHKGGQKGSNGGGKKR
jgi:hypothetical protein